MRGTALSDFQIALIGAGVLFLVVVWMINKWQERRVRRSVEQRFGEAGQDVLLEPGVAAKSAAGEARIEPTLGGGTAGAAGATAAGARAAAAAAAEIDLAEAGTAGAGAAQGAAQGAPQPVHIDEDINVTVLLAADQPVSGERILAALHNLRHAGRQPVTVVGAVGDENWTAIRPGGRYDTVLVAVQLANRGGPLNEIEFSEFIAGVQQAAEEIPASCDVPDMLDTIARARALDARCAPLDTMVGVNLVRQGGSWSGDLIAQVAEQNGMVLRPDGRFHYPGPDGVSLYILQDGEGTAFRIDTLTTAITDRLTFLLDVPHVARPEGEEAGLHGEPFMRMAKAAQLMAGQLGATLVDDNLRPLTPNALAAIDRQIAGVYARMEAEGIPAGSARARALFG